MDGSSNRMAITAMAHMMKLNKKQLLLLRDHCICISEKGDTASGYQISRAKFMASMGVVKMSMEPDYEVLEKLIVLWDKNGSDCIDPVSCFGLNGSVSICEKFDTITEPVCVSSICKSCYSWLESVHLLQFWI
jgi:hypothetical protein